MKAMTSGLLSNIYIGQSNFSPLIFYVYYIKIPQKNKITVNLLQISVLVPEIFKFEKNVENMQMR